MLICLFLFKNNNSQIFECEWVYEQEESSNQYPTCEKVGYHTKVKDKQLPSLRSPQVDFLSQWNKWTNAAWKIKKNQSKTFSLLLQIRCRPKAFWRLQKLRKWPLKDPMGGLVLCLESSVFSEIDLLKVELWATFRKMKKIF